MHSRARKYATTSEAAIRGLVLKGHTNAEIAAILNVHPQALGTVRSMLGIKSLTKRPDVDCTKSWWLPAMAAGASVGVIAKAEGISEFKVMSALKRRGLPTSRSGAAEHLRSGAGAAAPTTEGRDHAAA